MHLKIVQFFWDSDFNDIGFKYISILLFYIKNESSMKSSLKAKFVSMRGSCDFYCMYSSEEYLK